MAGAAIEPTGNKQGLPPLAGFNVVTKDGQQVYSRYTQEQLNARSQASQQSDQPNFSAEESTIQKQSQDQFQQQRQDALKTGRFDYNAVKSSFYSPPSNYVNTKGERVARLSKAVPEEKPLTSYDTRDTGVTTFETKPASFSLSDTAAQESSQKIYQSIKSPETPTNQKPIEQVINERINQLNEKIPQENQFIQQQNEQIEVNNAINKLVNQDIRKANIKSAKQEINDINNSLNQAKNAGINSVNIVDEKGNILGTVNPQNISQARLQTLKTLSKTGGKATLQYSIPTTQSESGITSTVTTPTFREDPLSLLGRPILEFGASVGAQIKEDIFNPQRNLINESPIVQLLTGKPLTGFGPTATVSQKLEESFGVGQEIEKVKSGQYKGIQQAAAVSGIIASVAIPVIAGTNIAAKVPELSSISSKIKDVNFESKFSKAYQEKTLEVHKEQLGNTMGFTQGTEESISLTGLKVEKGLPQVERLSHIIKTEKIDIGGGKTVEVSEKVPSGSKVQAVQPQLPKGISLTKNIETIGQIGTEKPSLFPQYKRPNSLFSPLVRSVKGFNPLKLVSYKEKSTLGFVNIKQPGDIYINAATKAKGSFSEQNLIDTLSHESLHNALQKISPEASTKIDELFSIENKLLKKGIEPSTFTPTEITPEEYFFKEQSLSEKTFEGQREPKRIFGKVIKEVPNIIDITAQKAKSGQAILPQAYLSKTQVGLVREPTGLPEQKILVSGKVRPEVKATLGLEPIAGQKDFFIGTLKTKGQRQYFEAAQKANLLTGRLSEIHVQAKADVSKAPDVYLAVSRNPDLLKGNKFPEIVRPEIIGYHESYPIKIQEFSKTEKITRAYKPMKPFEMSKSLKTGAGGQGKAKSILETAKSETTKLLEKPELFKTSKETSKYELTKGYTPILTKQRQRQQTELETTFLQYPKSNTKVISLTEGITTEKTRYNSNFDKLFKSKSNEKNLTTFKITTTPKIIQTPSITSLFKQETGSKLVQNTIQKQLQKTSNQIPPFKFPGEPGKKKPPFLFGGGRGKQGPSGISGGSGARKGYIGNVPESSIIGTYNRTEISYGGARTSNTHKSAFKKLQGSKSFKL